MAVSAVELYESPGIRLDGTMLVARRVFKVFNSDGTQVTLREARGATGLPRLTSYHPDDTRLRAIDYETIHEPGIGVYRVTVIYEGIQDGIPANRLDSGDQFARLEDEWRAPEDYLDGVEQWTVEPGPDVPPRNDIGGLHIDIWGNPVSVARTRAVYEYTIFWNRYDALPTSDWALIYGKRNSTAWFGNPIGTLLYTGARYRHYRSTVLAVTHRFVFDDRFHAVQVPERDQVNWPVLAPGEPVHAATVYWHQPFPATGDFDVLQIPAGVAVDPSEPDTP